MQPIDNGEPAEALACAHTFHSVCIINYMAAQNLTRANACPLRCGPQAETVICSDVDEEDGPADEDEEQSRDNNYEILARDAEAQVLTRTQWTNEFEQSDDDEDEHEDDDHDGGDDYYATVYQ